MKYINNQKGFMTFEIVLIILVLAATGTAGYFAYQSNRGIRIIQSVY